MAAPIDGDITNQDTTALLQGDGLIARSYVAALQITAFFGISSGETFAINHTSARDGYIIGADGIDEAVFKIGMSAVLIGCAFKKLCFIIGFHRSRSSENLGTSHQMQFHMAFHTDASAEISAGRQNYSSSTMSHTGVNGGIDGKMV